MFFLILDECQSLWRFFNVVKLLLLDNEIQDAKNINSFS